MTDEWTTIREWPFITLEQLPDAGVARIVMNRPEKHNALNGDLLTAFLDALETVRQDDRLKVVISKGSGRSYSSGNDLHDLKDRKLEDWDRATPSTRVYETVRTFPRITIAQIHGYCLGGALALVNSHDLAIAATDAKIGMPEILRGSYGQNVTATLFHSNIPIKKASYLQLTGRNLSGEDAERWGVVSAIASPEGLEATTTELAREIASRSSAALQHAKIAVQLGRDLALPEAIQVERLVTARMKSVSDPFGDIDAYLESQKGGTNVGYRRSEE